MQVSALIIFEKIDRLTTKISWLSLSLAVGWAQIREHLESQG